MTIIHLKRYYKHLTEDITMRSQLPSRSKCNNKRMSYDKKFRKKAIKYYEKGHTFKKTANIFEISTNTLNDWLKQKREIGDLERKYRSYKSKINEKNLNKYLKENPSAYQSEMAQYFKCNKSTVHGGRFTCNLPIVED